MAGSISTQTRFVGIVTSTIHPYMLFEQVQELTNHAGSNATIKADYPQPPMSIVDKINFSHMHRRFKLKIAPMGHHQQVHDNREKQVQECIVDVIIPTNLCILFDPAIPTSSFNYIVTVFLYLLYIGEHGMGGAHSHTKLLGYPHSPHQREFCTKGFLGQYALGMLGRITLI